MNDHKPRIYKMWPIEPDEDDPAWCVKWWNPTYGQWEECTHWYWKSALRCVTLWWEKYGKKVV